MKTHRNLIALCLATVGALTAAANTANAEIKIASQTERSSTLSVTGEDAKTLFSVFGKKEFKGFRLSLKNVKCSSESQCSVQLEGRMFTSESQALLKKEPYIANFGVNLSPYFERLSTPDQRVFMSPLEDFFFWEEHAHTKLFAKLYKQMSKVADTGIVKKNETDDYNSLQIRTANLDWTCYEYKNPKTEQQEDEWIPHGAILKSHDFKKTHLCTLASFVNLEKQKTPTFEVEMKNITATLSYFSSQEGYRPLKDLVVNIGGCDQSFMSMGAFKTYASQKTGANGNVNFSETYQYFYTDVNDLNSTKRDALYCPTISIKMPPAEEITSSTMLANCKLDPRNYLTFFEIDKNGKVGYVGQYVFKGLPSTQLAKGKRSVSVSVQPTKLNYFVAGSASKYNSQTNSYDLEGVEEAKARFEAACAKK